RQVRLGHRNAHGPGDSRLRNPALEDGDVKLLTALLAAIHALIFATFLVAETLAKSGSAVPVVLLEPGPYLFLDDTLIEHSSHLTRKVQPPRRDLAKPIVTGKEDKNDQPYVTVLRDPISKHFRMWYDAS